MMTEAIGCAKESRGRPKVFDGKTALDKTMVPSWRYGCEATSPADLVGATGARAPALYAEFTNKKGLFCAILGRCITRFTTKHEAQLFCEEKSLESALEGYFTAIATCFTSKGIPAGCFMINTPATLAASSHDITHTVKSRHAMQEQILTQLLRQRQ